MAAVALGAVAWAIAAMWSLPASEMALTLLGVWLAQVASIFVVARSAATAAGNPGKVAMAQLACAGIRFLIVVALAVVLIKAMQATPAAVLVAVGLSYPPLLFLEAWMVGKWLREAMPSMPAPAVPAKKGASDRTEASACC